MTRTILLLAVASLTMACTTFTVTPQAPAVEVSGRWVGTWRAVDLMNAPREGRIDLDITQDGARGRMTWTDTLLLTVDADDAVGAVNSSTPIEIRLVRIANPNGLTTLERLSRLEADAGRERERINTMRAKIDGVATDTQTARTTADTATEIARQAVAATGEWETKTGDTSTRISELERRIREGMNGNGHGSRAIVHTTDVRFAFDKADLDDAGFTTLTEIVELLRENPELTAELEGYADSLGSSEYNVRLSQRRVETVHRYLARRGVPLERLHIVGLGHLPESAPEARAKNRRVTVKLLVSEN
jgi:outer membrane protein OmpA-like peptidoglycan-associated protein